MYSYIVLGIAIIILIYIAVHFHPVKTQRIDDNLYVVQCMFVNFYVYKINDNIILFDCGMNKLLVKNGLKKINISPDEITDIFLTHSDYDHTGGIDLFKNAKVYISEKEEPLITNKKARRMFMYNNQINNYKTLKNEETIIIGNTNIKIIETPGHTDGSASYLINGNYLVTGDLLYLTRNKNIKPFIFVINMSHSQDKESIKKLHNVIENAEYVLTGHSGIKRKK